MNRVATVWRVGIAPGQSIFQQSIIIAAVIFTVSPIFAPFATFRAIECRH